MKVTVLLLLLVLSACSQVSSPVKKLALRSISSSGDELFMIPDEVEANGNLAKEMKIEGKKTTLYILSASDMKKIPKGTVLYNKNTGERVLKKKAMEKGWEALNFGFIREQIPEHRKWVEEVDSYPRVGEHPSEIVRRTFIPDGSNFDVPNLNMALEEPDRVYPLTPKQFQELPLGTEIHRYSSSFGTKKGHIETTHVGVEIIDIASDFDGETNWGIKIHQIPEYRFDDEGYFIPHRKSPVVIKKVKPSKTLMFSVAKSALNPEGERVYFLSRSDFDSLPKGVVLYHPNGTKYVKGHDALPTNDSRVAGGKFMKVGYRESQIPVSQIDKTGKSLFDRHYGKLKLGVSLGKSPVKDQSSCKSLVTTILKN